MTTDNNKTETQVTGRWIKADGTEETVTPRNGIKFKLDELQEMVGGWIEYVSLPSIRKNLIINEEGKLISLPMNRTASILWEAEYGPTDIIVGDALLVDFDEEDEE